MLACINAMHALRAHAASPAAQLPQNPGLQHVFIVPHYIVDWWEWQQPRMAKKKGAKKGKKAWRTIDTEDVRGN